MPANVSLRVYAHKAARTRLGPPPTSCPTCGCVPRPAKDGRITIEASYTGNDPRGYDPKGEEYTYECHSCNMLRSSDNLRSGHTGLRKSEETRYKISLLHLKGQLPKKERTALGWYV